MTSWRTKGRQIYFIKAIIKPIIKKIKLIISYDKGLDFNVYTHWEVIQGEGHRGGGFLRGMNGGIV